MGIFIGGTEIKDIKIGSTAINSVWIGANKIWDRILDTQTVTVGQQSNNHYGYMSLSIGSITDGTCNFKNNATIERIVWVQGVPAYNLPDKVFFMLYGNHSNSDFDTMTIAGTDFARTDATFSYISYSNLTSWEWAVTANPFGTSVGATKTVTWT